MHMATTITDKEEREKMSHKKTTSSRDMYELMKDYKGRITWGSGWKASSPEDRDMHSSTSSNDVGKRKRRWE
jgi:hypothetical protein